jgi:hypothetical protein
LQAILPHGPPAARVSHGRHGRLLSHIAANLPYYAAALIAAGDPTLRAS